MSSLKLEVVCVFKLTSPKSKIQGAARAFVILAAPCVVLVVCVVKMLSEFSGSNLGI